MNVISVSTPSIVEYFAEHEKYRCGYCKSPDTNFSFGMWAHTLRVQDYEELINRGWRRSGKYCYKPIMDQTCCPMYTIKCDALDFKVSKSQKKVIKKMKNFLRGELKKSESDDPVRVDADDLTADVSNCMENFERPQKKAANIDLSLAIDTELPPAKNSAITPHAVGESSSAVSVEQGKDSTSKNSTGKSCKAGIGLDQSKLPPKKAKQIRLERKQNKLLSLGKLPTEINDILKHGKPENSVKTLEDLFGEGGKPDGLELRLVRTSPMSPEYISTSKESYELYKKYQMTIHRDVADKLTEQQYTRFLVKSPLQITSVAVGSEQFLETFELSAQLYKKYQMAIHKDPPEECDEESFRSFLVESPLQPWRTSHDPEHGYGSFHQQYWHDKKLIAVGVIDILPSCISSVYFFYDPTYSFLSLGTFGSLCEVKLTRMLNKVVPNLKYYYMGFYIHTCPKMRYKAAMRPSKLLCPETYAWCDIERCLPKLDKEKCCRLNEDLDAIDENTSDDISQVGIYYKNRIMSYNVYKVEAKYPADENTIREYAYLVGNKAARKLRLYRS